ncbi:MAG: MarR family transcriptional regulator [Promethearchaeota archaeon]|nr:MAG: MarR family transcriptional regulator [Candidatus Lokiarchaeota archaeon]
MKKIGKAGLLIHKINRISNRIFSRKIRESNLNILTPSQFRIILLLLQKDLIPIHQVGDRLSLTKSTLTSVLDNLEESGLISRVPSKEDRRKILIKLESKGNETIVPYQQIISEMNAIFYNRFKEDEIENFELKLTKILENLKEYEKKTKVK